MKATCQAIFIAVAACAFAGCAPHRAGTAAGSRSSTRPIATTQPVDPEALLSLDEIRPMPLLSDLLPPTPTTAPTSRPSLDAIELYARARDAGDQNQRFTAINLLEKALALDPDSVQLNYDLGRAYTGPGGNPEKAIASFERAAALAPDDLEIRVELGRAYQSRGDINAAIKQFRLATQTESYKDDDPLAAVVDYRLAVALAHRGYVRASLQCYDHLLDRLEHPSSETRSTPEINYLLSRPELVYEEMGKLYEKLGDFSNAFQAYAQVADASPNDFDLQARQARMLVKLGRNNEATAAAADLVRKFHASGESIKLLRKTYADTGKDADFTDALRKLHRGDPNDRAILFALADTLASSGKVDEARDLLSRAIDRRDGDVEIVQRLYDLYSQQDRVIDAARLIIRVTAAHPDTTAELQPLFADLLRLSRKNSLRLTTLQKIDVPADAQAAKLFWVWQVANAWTRPATAQNALDQSAHATKPFDPACRALLDSYYARSDWDEPAKQTAADVLIDSVASRGRPDLAEELRGLVSLHADRSDQAVEHFSEAVKLTVAPRTPSPDLQLEFAVAQLKQGNAPRFEQLMWKLLSDRPRFGTGYKLLLSYFKQNNAYAKAWNLVNTWLAADPNSVDARVQQAVELVQQRRVDEAIALVKKLFQERPDDSDVVGALVILLNSAGQPQQAIDLLEAERSAHPANRVAVEGLVDIYSAQKRLAEASRVLDAARAAVANDPDLLYYIAHLYQQIDQPQTSEDVLAQVLKLDPTHAQAGNDLGYTWADQGKNLDRAEQLIKLAVDAEPDNPSYLDSLGWVLYKRSRFEQARKLLEQACQPAETADPVVLDHLGDVLYRLHQNKPAQDAWKRSLERMGNVADREELRKLKLQLQTKLRQAEAGQPVTVAPVVESNGDDVKPEQAKN